MQTAVAAGETSLSPNRLNVAISRALVLVVGSPYLGDVRVRSMEEMQLVSGWCRVEGVEGGRVRQHS